MWTKPELGASLNVSIETAPVGIQNVGATCWLNSILQCILSCKYVREFLRIDATARSNNLQKILRDAINDPTTMSSLGGRILNELRNSKCATAQTIVDGQQQSASEAFLILVDMLNLEWFFEQRYKQIISCDCGHVAKQTDTLIHINGTPGLNLSNYIKTNSYIIDGYKCVCGAANVIHTSKAILLPEYIVVFWNKYHKKYDAAHPDTLTIERNEQPLKYKLIAQVEHSGSLNGGHYYAYVARDSGTYVCNDNSISAGELKSTSNTYMAFYEMVVEEQEQLII